MTATTEAQDFSHSKDLGELLEALTKFQNSNVTVKKDAKNPHFKSTYTSLPNLLETIHEPMQKHGLSVLQLPLGGIEICRLLIRLSHASGQYVQWLFSTPVSKRDPQGIGAATTYLRRYSLTTVLGLPEEDDDGNTASQVSTPSYQASSAPAGDRTKTIANPGLGATDKQMGFIKITAVKNGWTSQDVEACCGTLFKKDFKSITKGEASDLIKFIGDNAPGQIGENTPPPMDSDFPEIPFGG